MSEAKKLRVQFVHGLEGSPQGSKAQELRRHFDVVAASMDTTDFDASVRAQADALSASKPDVVVGSSFGGAVVLALLEKGLWRGPTLLLAPAHRHFSVSEKLPEGFPIWIVHGLRDSIIPVEASRVLASTRSDAGVRLIEVDDEHRLRSLLEENRLADLVRGVAAAH